jgi:hypothetical protein
MDALLHMKELWLAVAILYLCHVVGLQASQALHDLSIKGVQQCHRGLMLVQGGGQCLQDFSHKTTMLAPEVRGQVVLPVHTMEKLMKVGRFSRLL